MIMSDLVYCMNLLSDKKMYYFQKFYSSIKETQSYKVKPQVEMEVWTVINQYCLFFCDERFPSTRWFISY